MTLAPGTKLGPYEILEQIGAGGMGEVYKARDTRLDRTVAIKVLPAHWAADPEMKERFEREAHTIAALNHPHICVLHDIGEQEGSGFLVMEYLQGETLAQRLERGALGLEEALKTAIAIADALDKAHRFGVVHRDLKPANVMLTEGGPKLLDFGLAKWMPSPGLRLPSPSGRGPNPAPGEGSLTTPGMILGTLQYMAPEQLEGIEADARTDIFAFGVLLHEMVTGKKAFEGQSQVLLMSAIATAEPPALSKVEPATPAALEHVVKTCLAKSPKDRWQTARDVLAELEWIAAPGAQTVIAAPVSGSRGKRERRLRLLLAAAALFAAVTLLPASLYIRGPAEPGEFRFRFPQVYSAQPLAGNIARLAQGDFAVSPDGSAVAYVTTVGAFGAPDANDFALFVRPLGSITPQRLTGTDEASQPFWSADGRSIAFVSGGRLKKIEATGGPPQDIGPAPDFTGGTWNAEDTIVFGSSKGLFRVSAQGGTPPEAVTKLDASETGHFWPQFLPGGRHYLYLAWSADASKRAIFAGDLDSAQKTRILPADSKAFYADPGYLLFRREDTVYAQPFNSKTLKLSGNPARVADGVPSITSDGQGSFAVSPTGALVYYRAGDLAGVTGRDELDRQLISTDRNAMVEPLGPPGRYRGLEVSPDGRRIAVHRHDGAGASGGDVWVIEPAPQNPTRITRDPSRTDNSMAVWSPTGKQLVYASIQKGKWALYRTSADGSGAEELLCCESELPKVPMSWIGKYLVFWTQDPKTGGDLWVVEPDGEKKPRALLNTAANETHGQISPDGKWIAYTSDATRNRREVYVKSFPSLSGEWQISNNGGDWPRWSRDSKELFYHSIGPFQNPNGEGARSGFNGLLYAVSVNAQTNSSTIVPSTPREILTTVVLNPVHSGGDFNVYDVHPDFKHFLLFQVVPPNTADPIQGTGPDPVNGLIVALHWASGLKSGNGVR
jgi:eukaryotic-like serine/threonine-protein kinase